MEQFVFEFIKEALGDAAKSSLTEKITVFMVAWFFVRRTVKEHFTRIENQLGAVADNVGELKTELIKVQTGHDGRLQVLEKGWQDLKQDVDQLKNKGE